MIDAHPDPVDRALERLRADDVLECPDAALEARLRRAFPRRRSRSQLLRAAMLLVGLCLCAATVEATGALDALRAWWYAITIDGRVERGALPTDGTRRFEYTTQDGCAVTIEIQRRTGARGAVTGIHVRSAGPSRSPDMTEVTEVEVATRTLDEGDDTADAPEHDEPLLRLPRAAIAGATRLHDWIEARGRRALHWQLDPATGAGRLAIEDVDSHEDLPVLVIGQPERGPGADTLAIIRDDGDGGLEIELGDDAGWRFALAHCSAPAHAAFGRTEVTTPDGRVRVEVGER